MAFDINEKHKKYTQGINDINKIYTGSIKLFLFQFQYLLSMPNLDTSNGQIKSFRHM